MRKKFSHYLGIWIRFYMKSGQKLNIIMLILWVLILSHLGIKTRVLFAARVYNYVYDFPVKNLRNNFLLKDFLLREYWDLILKMVNVNLILKFGSIPNAQIISVIFLFRTHHNDSKAFISNEIFNF